MDAGDGGCVFVCGGGRAYGVCVQRLPEPSHQHRKNSYITPTPITPPFPSQKNTHSTGASAVLLELCMPYSEGATSAYLHPNNDDDDDDVGEANGQEKRDWGYCSAGAARALAEVGIV